MRPSILTLSASPPAPRLQPVKWVTKVGPDGYSGCVWDVNSLKLFRFPAVGLPSAPFLRDGAGRVPPWGASSPRCAAPSGVQSRQLGAGDCLTACAALGNFTF